MRASPDKGLIEGSIPSANTNLLEIVMLLTIGSFTLDEWKAWGEQFGWKLHNANEDEGEFRIQHDGGTFEVVFVTNRMRLCIDQRMERAENDGYREGKGR